jgi:hypothetical protein
MKCELPKMPSAVLIKMKAKKAKNMSLSIW